MTTALIQTNGQIWPMIHPWPRSRKAFAPGWVGAVVYILSQVIILYLRVPYGHLLYMLNAGVTFILAIIILLPGNLAAAQWLGAIALVLGGLQVVITMNLWPDFTFKEKRLRLQVDRSAKTADAFYLTGRNYAREGEWGNAVIHLRRAVSLKPLDLDYHLALTVAYLQVKRADLARNSLAEAAKLQPTDPQVKKLQQRLAATADQSEQIG
jgi:tetratricopeptide (TPR) repeat protein